MAALSLLAEVAEEQPLLCLVDDAQWLDTASRQVFGFVARRLLAEPVALVLAVREPTDERELVGLPEMSLTGLADDDARALLEAVVPGRLDERVRDRIDERQFQVFDLCVAKGWPPADVAQTLRISVARVYLTKHRVSALVKKEVQRLEKIAERAQRERAAS